MRILQRRGGILVLLYLVCGLLAAPTWAEFEFRELECLPLSESLGPAGSFLDDLRKSESQTFVLDGSKHFLPRGLEDVSPPLTLAGERLEPDLEPEIKPGLEHEAEPETEPEPERDSVFESEADLFLDFEDFDFPDDEDQTYPYLEQWGHFQIQFDDSRLGARTSAVPARSGLAPYPAIDNLYFRRFRPTLRYHLNPDLFMEFKTNIEPEIQRFFIMDLMMGFRVADNATLLVGRQKTPFGFEGYQSSRFIHTAERSEVTFYIYPERDIGVSVMQESDGTEFHVGLFLGQPRSTGDTTGRADLIGRVSLPVNDNLRVGLSGHMGAYRPSALGETLPVRRVGVEAQYENGPWKLESEVMASRGFNQASQEDTPAFGYYVTAVRRLNEDFDLVLSYDQFNPDLDTTDFTFPNNRFNARARAILGLNYYISRDPAHRVLLNYEFKQTLEGPKLDRSGVRLRYQFAW